MNNKTNLLEDYVKFVTQQRKKNILQTNYIFFSIIVSVFLFFHLIKYLNE